MYASRSVTAAGSDDSHGAASLMWQPAYNRYSYAGGTSFIQRRAYTRRQWYSADFAAFSVSMGAASSLKTQA